tara:strand:+ start:358 stop:495 length:138 start_codon:yes stop_codon:yes gene_type:complete
MFPPSIKVINIPAYYVFKTLTACRLAMGSYAVNKNRTVFEEKPFL